MSYTILLVDDDRTFRQEFRDYLEGYEVVEASSGEEAIELIRKPHEIDLVILDVRMPGLRGTEVLKKIKKMNPDMKIIILTGYSTKDTAIEALKGHADDYIEKPVDIERTKAIIEKLLDLKRGGENIESSDARGKVERVKNFAVRNWDKKVSLTDAAAKVFLSPKYLSRIFKQYAGTKFSDFCMRIKIEKAKELLRRTGYNVDQISDKVGYKNPESFIRTFKRFVRCTPTEYRAKGKRENRNRPSRTKSSSKKQ